MLANIYQDEAEKTAIYPREGLAGKTYPVHLLAEEAGEVSGKVAKWIRDGWSHDQIQRELHKELGDVLWAVAMVATEFELNLADIMEANLLKLRSRQERGVLNGSGDNR